MPFRPKSDRPILSRLTFSGPVPPCRDPEHLGKELASVGRAVRRGQNDADLASRSSLDRSSLLLRLSGR